MFGKLFRYEWKSQMRSVLPVCAALLALSLVNGVLLRASRLWEATMPSKLRAVLDFVMVLAQAFYGILLVALFVFVLVVFILRFYNGMLGREGYLAFTLPVKTWQLVWSKAAAAMVMWVVVAGIAALSAFVFSMVGVFVPSDWLGVQEQLARLGRFMQTAEAWHTGLIVLELLLLLILSFFGGIFHFYLAMAFGQLSRDHKVLLSVVWYVVIDMVKGLVFLLLGALVFNGVAKFWPQGIHIEQMSSLAAMGVFEAMMLFVIVGAALQMAVLAGATVFTLDRHLNLE